MCDGEVIEGYINSRTYICIDPQIRGPSRTKRGRQGARRVTTSLMPGSATACRSLATKFKIVAAHLEDCVSEAVRQERAEA